ncbi:MULTISPECIES: XRE family transcriptional regulator [Pseudomonas]|uniref:LexA family protein n=1 Tax=Pseudomonas TaxID=286 RepID=UPI0030021F78
MYEQDITSNAVCTKNSGANKVVAMTKRRPLTPEEVAECARLKAAYEARKAALKAQGKSITQADVAEACGWSGQSAFSQYATGKVPLNLEALMRLSTALSFSPDQVSPRLAGLISNSSLAPSNIEPALQPQVTRRYPLISRVPAGLWEEAIDNYQPFDGEEWIDSPVYAGENGFWLRVKGDSMTRMESPSFPDGTLVLVEPWAPLISGKYYVAKLEDSNEVTFKQYVEDAGIKYLRPLNSSYRTIEINGNCKFVGRVVDARMVGL